MQKKLRIAIVCDAIDDSSLGGSFISGKRFAAWLAKAGHEIIRITSKFREEERRSEFAYAQKIYEFPYLPPIGAYGVRFAYTSASRLSKIFQQEHIDVIYSIQPTILARQAVRAAKKCHIPIVSHSHTLPDLFMPWAPRFIQKLIKNIVAWMYKKYDGLIYPTEFLKQRYADCGFTKPEVIIGNGVDTLLFHPHKKTHNDHLVVLCVGRLDPAKNQIVLLDALKILHTQQKIDTHIRCIFVWGWILEKNLQKLSIEYGVSTVVEFTWRLGNERGRLITLYQNASMFVLPSLYETEWMVVLEAMACGCPLLISDSPSNAAKAFIHNNGYTFACRDPKDLADKILRLANNPDLRKSMSKESLSQAQKHSFTTSVEKLESFLSSLVQE